jgi:O-antigen/teichoic acid export membrane protein
MLQNSLFLMASAGLTAGIGFIFWALVAHLYTAERIGLATSMLSAISLISYLSLFGFNATLIRYPAEGAARNSQISLAIGAVCVASCVLGAAYLDGLRFFGPQLEFIRASRTWAPAFVAICMFASVNLLTDSVFIGARIPQFNTLVDGIIQSLAKLAMPVFLVAFGAVGIVAATGVGYAVAVIASFFFMYRKVGFRLDLGTKGTRLRENARYSATSYLSALLNLFPLLVLPSIVLRSLGPEQAAYYFLAYQIATLLTAVSHAIGDVLFAEGAHDPAKTGELLRRSAKIMTVVVVPSSLLITVLRTFVLDLFGTQYVKHAQGVLTILALGSIAVAFNTWASNALRIVGRMRQLVVSNVVYTAVVVGFAAAFGARGLDWIGYAWVLGNFASGLAAAVCIPRHPAAASDAVGESHAAMDPAYTPEDAWHVFNDRPTEPLFFPWNRPEAVRMTSLSATPIPAAGRGGSRPTARPRSDPPAGQPFRNPGGMKVRPHEDAGDR